MPNSGLKSTLSLAIKGQTRTKHSQTFSCPSRKSIFFFAFIVTFQTRYSLLTIKEIMKISFILLAVSLFTLFDHQEDHMLPRIKVEFIFKFFSLFLFACHWIHFYFIYLVSNFKSNIAWLCVSWILHEIFLIYYGNQIFL